MPKTLDSYLADRVLTRQLYLMRFSAGEKKKVLDLFLQMQAELKMKLANGFTSFEKKRLTKLLVECTDVISGFYASVSPPTNIMGYEIKYINKAPKNYLGKHFPDSKTIEIFTKGRTTQQIQSTLEHELGHVVDYARRGIVASPFGDSVLGYDNKLRAAIDSDIYFRDFRLKEAEAIRAEFPRAVRNLTQKEIYADAYRLYINDPEKLKAIAPRIYGEIDGFVAKNQMYGTQTVDLLGLAKAEAAATQTAIASIGLEASLPSAAVLKAMVSDTLLQGAPLSAWWAKQAEDTAFKFSAQVRQGVAQGETLQQVITRIVGSKKKGIVGIMEISHRHASTLVHDSIMQIANDARMATYKANADIMKGFEWLATLDGNTCVQCMAYSGAQWDMEGKPIKGDLPLKNPPLHPNCRCVLTSITKTFKELGIKGLPELPDTGERASDLGPIDRKTTMDQFLKMHDTEWQDEMLGKGKAKLWRDGKITLQQLVSGEGRELSLAQLKALAAK